MSTIITLPIEQSNVNEETGVQLQDTFGPFLEQAEEWQSKASELVVTDESQTGMMKDAREARLALKGIRVNVEHKRKDLKEDSLREGKAIDGVAKALKDLITPIEEHLEKQEKYAEIKEQERLSALKVEREAALTPYVADISYYDVMNMTEEGFNELLESSKLAHKKKKEEEAKAEKERLAKEKADREENERLRRENEQLLKEKEDRKKVEEKAALKIVQASDEAKAAPDKDKLNALAETIDSLELPQVESDGAKQVISDTMNLLSKTTAFIREKAEKL